MGVIRYIFWNGSSNYNGLNVNLDKKFSHGLQFQVAYTYSKSLDDTSQTIAGDTFGNGINSPWWLLPQAFYGPSDFNVAHTLSHQRAVHDPHAKIVEWGHEGGFGGLGTGRHFHLQQRHADDSDQPGRSVGPWERRCGPIRSRG